jgi:hypothetical protein
MKAGKHNANKAGAYHRVAGPFSAAICMAAPAHVAARLMIEPMISSRQAASTSGFCQCTPTMSATTDRAAMVDRSADVGASGVSSTPSASGALTAKYARNAHLRLIRRRTGSPPRRERSSSGLGSRAAIHHLRTGAP